jgi:quercetin dioxygenase-like cupin family protein
VQIIRAHAPGQPAEVRTATFTGTVYADPVFSADDVTVANVFFTPGARTYWHHHERGQFLVVTAGFGLICSAGETPQELQGGDTGWVPPGERHWHGGGPDTYVLHTAVSLGRTNWHDEVSGEEYRRP